MNGMKKKFVFISLFGFCLFLFFILFFKSNSQNNSVLLKQPEEISFALFTHPQKLDINSQDISIDKILFPMHLGLVTHNYKGELYSGVASSWHISEDKLDYIFELNTNLFFHNGKKLTCDDVEASFANILNGSIPTPLTEMMASAQCVGDDKFNIHLNEPSSLFLPLLTYDVAVILPKEQGDVSHTVTGLGPYKLKEMTEDQAVLENVENHPQLRSWSPKRIRYIFFDNIPQAVEAFERGKVDIVDLSGFSSTSSKNETSTSFYPLRIWLLSFGSFFSGSDGTISCIQHHIGRENLADELNRSTPNIFSAAYGLVRPYNPGYIEGRDGKMDPDIGCFSDKTVSHIIAIKNLVREELLKDITKEFSEMGAKVEFDLLTKEKWIGEMDHADYAISLASVNVSHLPEQQLNKFYDKKSLFPFTKSLSVAIHDDLKDIQRTSSKSQRANKIYAFEKDRFENPVIVPLLFQKASYLIRDCLSVENITMTSSYEKLQEVGMIKDCE